jgi:hypothetical protein
MSTVSPPTAESRVDATSAGHVVSRVLASLLGSYFFVWGFISLGTVLAVAAGMPYADAQTLFYMLAFLLFVACFCWAFSARSLARVWLAFGAGGALMTLGAWALTNTLV